MSSTPLPGTCTGLSAASDRDSRPSSPDRRILLFVPGMRGTRDLAVVRQALQGIAGVMELRGDVGSQTVWVRFDPVRIAAETLLSALSGQGFVARLVRLRSNHRQPV